MKNLRDLKDNDDTRCKPLLATNKLQDGGTHFAQSDLSKQILTSSSNAAISSKLIG